MARVTSFPAPPAATLTPEQAETADRILAMVAEIEEAEARLKALLRGTLDRGDVETAEEILRRWESEPAGDILASLEGKH